MHVLACADADASAAASGEPADSAAAAPIKKNKRGNAVPAARHEPSKKTGRELLVQFVNFGGLFHMQSLVDAIDTLPVTAGCSRSTKDLVHQATAILENGVAADAGLINVLHVHACLVCVHACLSCVHACMLVLCACLSCVFVYIYIYIYICVCVCACVRACVCMFRDMSQVC